MFSRRISTFLIAILLDVSLVCAQDATQELIQPEILKIPMKGAGAFGGDVEMVTHLYKPQGNGPFPVVLFSHGRSGERDERWDLKFPVLVGHGNFWSRKGFAVVAPIRPGYGETGGVDRELSGATGTGGSCRGVPNYIRVAKSAGEAVLATLDWVRSQPWSNTDRLLLVGQSVGGLTSIGVSAMNLPGVVSAINFSGGAGDLRKIPLLAVADPRNWRRYLLSLERQPRYPLYGFMRKTISTGALKRRESGTRPLALEAAKRNS